MPRVLITGATGFVGGHLTAALIADGSDIHIVHRPTSSLEAIASYKDRITPHVGEGDPGSLIDIIEAVKPDIVYHLAAHYVAVHKPSDITSMIKSNVLFGTCVLEAMVQTGCRNIVMAGTTWQHFRSTDPAPTNLYAATKAAQEAIASYYVSAHGISLGVLLMTDTYGPGDPRRKLFHLLREASRGGVPIDMSPGDQMLDLTYIDDAISAILAAGEIVTAGPGGTLKRWVVKSDVRMSLRDVVAAWQRETGRTIDVNWGKKPYRSREVMVPWAECGTVPGWIQRVSLEDGIRRMELFDV